MEVLKYRRAAVTLPFIITCFFRFLKITSWLCLLDTDFRYSFCSWLWIIGQRHSLVSGVIFKFQGWGNTGDLKSTCRFLRTHIIGNCLSELANQFECISDCKAYVLYLSTLDTMTWLWCMCVVCLYQTDFHYG